MCLITRVGLMHLCPHHNYSSSAGGKLGCLIYRYSLVPCRAQAHYSLGLCVVSFYGLNRLIWEVEAAQTRRSGRVLLRSFDSFLFSTISVRDTAEENGSQWPPCWQPVSLRSHARRACPHARLPHARYTHYRGLRLCGELLRFATPAPLQRMR